MRAPARLDPFVLARRMLRPHLYVGLLDAAATTGYMPHLDRFGRPDPNLPPTPLDADQRLASLRYLTDKSLATPKAEEAPANVDLDTAIKDMRALSSGELAALVTPSQDPTDADFTEVVLDPVDFPAPAGEPPRPQ